jgi:protoporphyrinogen/coproporphyrinogen III oxidase
VTEPDSLEPRGTENFDELVSHAHETRVVVIGGGIGGLVAALECAKVGMRVTLLEASDRLGGVIQTIEIAGLHVDVGPQGFAARDGAVRRLVDELGLGSRTVAPEPRSLWLAGVSHTPVPLPVDGVLGIPQNPWDERVRRIIGWRGTWRAYLDRLRPPLTIGQERSLGRLVHTRMGDRVLERLVAPLSLGAFAIHPLDVDVEIAAPGLSAALTRTGSLAGAVAQVRNERADAAAGTAFEGLAGGMSTLVDAIRTRLDDLGVEVRLGTAAESIQASADGRWEVRSTRADAPDPAGPVVADGVVVDPVAAEIVLVATPEATARQLLGPLATELERAVSPTAHLDVLTLVVDSAALSAAPRRTDVYPIAGSSRAAAIADLTAQWPALRAAAGADRHVLRLTFGGPAEAASAPAVSGLPDVDAIAIAVAEASALLGIALDPRDVRGLHRQTYAQPRPVSAIGHAAQTAAVRTAIATNPGLAAVGAWLAGTGVAQVVPDAVAEAERVRRAALWGRAI